MSQFHANDYDYPGGSHIRLRSGIYIDLLNPSPSAITLDDVAHALSHICRFGGHVAAFYSVAEHSLNVSNMLARQFGHTDLAAWGLFHDATEAYLGDMVRPLKRNMDTCREAESRMAEAVRQRFGFMHGFDTDPRVRAADECALVWEMATVRDAEWRTPSDPATVKTAFLRQAARLGVA